MQQDERKSFDWGDLIDTTLQDLASTKTVRDYWTPMKDYIQTTIDKLSFLLTCLLGLQVLLVFIIMGDFLLNLRSIFVVTDR